MTERRCVDVDSQTVVRDCWVERLLGVMVECLTEFILWNARRYHRGCLLGYLLVNVCRSHHLCMFWVGDFRMFLALDRSKCNFVEVSIDYGFVVVPACVYGRR